MARPKTNCFAYEMRPDGLTYKCTALAVMECRVDDGECPFYKPLKQELDELQRNNGVLSIEAAIKAYAKCGAQKKVDEANG